MGLFRAVPICRSSGQSDTESKSEENRREERKGRKGRRRRRKGRASYRHTQTFLLGLTFP